MRRPRGVNSEGTVDEEERALLLGCNARGYLCKPD